jgi:hypothetical protein
VLTCGDLTGGAKKFPVPKYAGAAATPPLAWEERRKEKECVIYLSPDNLSYLIIFIGWLA